MKELIKKLYQNIFYSKLRYTGAFTRFENIFRLSQKEKVAEIAMQFTSLNKIKGDYLEFGVHGGNSFVPAYHFAQKYKLDDMKFYGFDSFEGLPDNNELDTSGYKIYNKGQLSCGLKEFLSTIKKRGVDLSKVKTIEGWYDKTLTERTKAYLPIKKATVVWIDCDLYESTVPVLEFITSYLQNGTILIFDDYYSFRGDPTMGEQRALSEWLENNPEIKISQFHRVGAHGNSFIVHKKVRTLNQNETRRKS